MTGGAQRAVQRSWVARIDRSDDLDGWRQQARSAIHFGVPPSALQWRVAGRASGTASGAVAGDLFAPLADPLPAPHDAPPMRIARALRDALDTALLHRDPARFALCYRVLWRNLQGEPVIANPADRDAIALHALAKSVRRDIHKMHAFVRFRKVADACPETNGRDRFVAWFEPDHHITRAVGPFFRNRFTGMDWTIVTPDATIHWDGQSLTDGPGGSKQDAPGDDALEEEWRTYYAHIFNPARLKINAMRAEMPVKYWKNLPEAELIAGLVRDAALRTSVMIDRSHEKSTSIPRHDPRSAPPVAGVSVREDAPDLATLHHWLMTDSVAAGPQFAERPVAGEGPANATIMLVGEQPGDEEDRAGRPFIGPAGQVLNSLLAEAGLDRSAAFVTSAVRRFKFVMRGPRRLHQTPTAADILHDRWWLAQELRLIRPRVVVALGATAIQSLTGERLPVGKVRGEPRSCPLWPEAQLMPTMHPSYLLRLPDASGARIERGRIVRDLSAAVAIAQSELA